MFSINKSFAFVVLLLCVMTAIVVGKPAEIIPGSVAWPSEIEVESLDEEQFETTPFCKSRKHRINPNDLFESSNEIWDFDENFTQTIEVELCENEDAPCFDHPILKTKCRQKFISVQLQVVSRNSTQSQKRTFNIPSACECGYRKLSLY